MQECCIRVGDLDTLVRIPDEHFADIITERYASFLSDTCNDGVVLDLKLLDAPFELGHRLPTVSENADRLHISRQDTAAESTDQGSTWNVEIIKNEYSFDSFFRVLFTIRLLGEGGFLIHSSAQIRHERGCIFTGKSEAGKTTISKLGTENRVLCDELPMVRRTEDGYRVYGTPFWGEFTRGTITDSNAVHALFFLNKAPYNKTSPLSLGRALPRLLQTVLFFSNEHNHIEHLMKNCLEFLEAVPSHDLYFRPEPEVWDAVDGAIL